MANRRFDVLVIGAGQAGLALAYHLRETGLDYLLVDGHGRAGDSWRRRWDSLSLFTPRSFSALPGRPMTGDPDGYPDKDEMADYLEAYADYFRFPLSLGRRVRRLERDDGGFRADTDQGALRSNMVVLATGPFQRPLVPELAQRIAPEVLQLTTESYRNPSQLPGGTVLVAGDGASGRQIARELSRDHRVLLATGRARSVVPSRLLGKDVFWWQERLGLLLASSESRAGRRMRARDPFPGWDLRLGSLRKRGIVIVGRVDGASGRRVSFTSGPAAAIDAVVWAIGFREDDSWVAIAEAKDEAEGIVHERGVTKVPGLLVIGRSWQSGAGSARLYGVDADARYVLERILCPDHAQCSEKDAAGRGRLRESRGRPHRKPARTLLSD